MATTFAAVALTAAIPGTVAQGEVRSCADGWQADVLATDLGPLENLEYDGAGGFYVSGLLRGEILHVDAAGTVTLVLSGLDRPAGLRLSGDTLYFVTGDGSTLNGGGTLRSLDLFQVLRIPLDAPDEPEVVATITDGFLPVLDDLDVAADGTAYVTGDYSGNVYRVDTTTGAWCTIATGWTTPPTPLPSPPPIGPTSARFAPDGPSWSLYVTGIDGTLRRLRPPPPLDLTPPTLQL
ncbi:hypothetical protein [Nocardia ignorata]|uniref:SMP-30/gluconolaconase/LRE-like protein n=1 Tax=Nocardia ignorata TaxID=145285 RepID=A0A4R6PQT2_NOCIG|nr:hypothetical protein [Nocardia ignorata]TDP40968.1 hypothetical protein DFR75_10166 [Nocardia ignorata]